MKKRLRKKMSKEWEWYAVKVLYECNISGNPSPETIDENYSNTHKTFEESIILIKAPSFEQAYVIAEMEAKKAEIDYLNPYVAGFLSTIIIVLSKNWTVYILGGLVLCPTFLV